jgi:tetratricopeptide (TPR) repeat protein
MRDFMLKVSVAAMALAMAGYGACIGDSPQGNAPMQSMTVAELEKAGDDCRAQKDYEQAIKYLNEAVRQDKKNAHLYNKLGMARLKSGDLRGARGDFTKATKYDRTYPDAWNNVGAVYYLQKNYGQAAKYYKKAVALDETRPTFHLNLGAAWFAQNELNRAISEYTRALELDPDALARGSNVGIAAQVTTPEERAKHNYMLAKIYAKLGNIDNCLACLRKAKENGYHDLAKVYKDEEFAALWHDARLAEIIPPPAPQ